MNRLEGKIAIVTGVTRQNGIGSSVCRKLASAGADIFFTHLSGYDLKQKYEIEDNFSTQFSNELRDLGVRVENMELDLMDNNSVSRLLSAVHSKLGLPSILVNNATHCEPVNFRNLTPEILDQHYFVNVRGTLMLSVQFAKLIEGKTPGCIINFVSGQDKSPQPNNLAYVTTKGAISTFTMSVAPHLAKFNITINAIDPGPTDTGWMTEDIKNELISKFPRGRIGTPDDAAQLVAFLVSEESQWITGQIVHSDGGYWD